MISKTQNWEEEKIGFLTYLTDVEPTEAKKVAFLTDGSKHNSLWKERIKKERIMKSGDFGDWKFGFD